MARRRNMKDLLTPDPTPDRQLNHPSGWCMTSDHEGCKYQFNHGKCGCDCHIGTKLVEIAPTTVSNDKPKRRGRPPKITQEVNHVTSEVSDPRPWRKK